MIDAAGRGKARVERGDGGVVPGGDLPEEDGREDRAGQVQPGTRREVQVVGHAFGAQGVGYLGDRAAFGGCQFAGVHGHVGGAEVGLLGADRGDARAAAHGGIGHGDRRVQLVVPGEGQGEERGDVRRAGPVRVPGPPLGPMPAVVLAVLVVVLLLHAPVGFQNSATRS